jgi:hypothetical protein
VQAQPLIVETKDMDWVQRMPASDETMFFVAEVAISTGDEPAEANDD